MSKNGVYYYHDRNLNLKCEKCGFEVTSRFNVIPLCYGRILCADDDVNYGSHIWKKISHKK